MEACRPTCLTASGSSIRRSGRVADAATGNARAPATGIEAAPAFIARDPATGRPAGANKVSRLSSRLTDPESSHDLVRGEIVTKLADDPPIFVRRHSGRFNATVGLINRIEDSVIVETDHFLNSPIVSDAVLVRFFSNLVCLFETRFSCYVMAAIVRYKSDERLIMIISKSELSTERRTD